MLLSECFKDNTNKPVCLGFCFITSFLLKLSAICHYLLVSMCAAYVSDCLFGTEAGPEGQMSQFGTPPYNLIYSFKPPANTDKRGGEQKERKKERERENAEANRYTQITAFLHYVTHLMGFIYNHS